MIKAEVEFHGVCIIIGDFEVYSDGVYYTVNKGENYEDTFYTLEEAIKYCLGV